MNTTAGVIETDVPARLDRLPWSRFHWMVVLGLGTVWILDGLEVTIVGSDRRAADREGQRDLDHRQRHRHGCGDLRRGRLPRRALLRPAHRPLRPQAALPPDARRVHHRHGRDGLRLRALVPLRRALLHRRRHRRRVRGDQLRDRRADPRARARPRRPHDQRQLLAGRRDRLGRRAVVPQHRPFAKDFGWRLAFGCGAVLGLSILLVRRNVPESPRWLFIHGREDEAEKIVDSIEQRRARRRRARTLSEPDETITVEPAQDASRSARSRRSRSASTRSGRCSCLALFIGQAFLYNAITFDLGTILTTYFERRLRQRCRYFIVIFAVGQLPRAAAARPALRHRRPQDHGRRSLPRRRPLIGACSPFSCSAARSSEWTFIALVCARSSSRRPARAPPT